MFWWVTICWVAVLKVVEQKTLVKRRCSYKVRITVYVQTPGEFCQKRVYSQNWKQFARYSFSFLGGIRLGQQTRKRSESTASSYLAERWTIKKIRRQLNSTLIPTSHQIFQGRIQNFSLESRGCNTKERRNWLLTWRAKLPSLRR